MIKIGYAHQTTELIFLQNVYESLQQSIAVSSLDIQVLERDNRMDSDIACKNMQYFADKDVDVVVTCHVDERNSWEHIKPLIYKRIPIIALEIPVPSANFIGIDNHLAGTLLGTGLGDWVNKHWSGEVSNVLMMSDYRITGVIRERFQLTVSSFLERTGKSEDIVLELHSGNIRRTAYEMAYPVLESWAKKTSGFVIIGGNDETGMGAYDAALELGLKNRVVVGGHGATIALEEFQKPDSRFVVTTDFHAECYGQPMLDLIVDVIEKRRINAKELIIPELLLHPAYIA